MTTEELLKPRWKVIADFPRSVYVVGEIIVHGQIGRETQINYDSFPQLFEPLPWWKDRKVEDMPEYLKLVDSEQYSDRIGEVFPNKPGAFRKFMAYGFTTDQDGFVTGFDNTRIELFAPATIEEYEAYLKTTNQLKDGE